VRLPVGDPERSGLRHLVDEVAACNSLAISPYWRCDIRCSYCITGAPGRSEARVARADVAAQLEQELASFPADALLAVGIASDAYPLIEAELGLTREVLRELARLGRTISVVTKSTTVTRDIDVLRAADAQVTISVSTADEEHVRALEPHAPSFAARMEAAAELHRSGVRVWISATPWIPDVSDAAVLIHQVRTVVGFVPILIGALNVRAERVVDTPFGRRFTQADINEAFDVEYRRVGEQPGVQWLQPPPLVGHHANTTVLDLHTGAGAGTEAVRVAPPRRLARSVRAAPVG
jgi:hypothetical protein